MEFLHKHSDTLQNDSIDQRWAATFQGGVADGMSSSSWSVVQHGTLATLIETWKNILFYVLLLPDVFLHFNVIYISVFLHSRLLYRATAATTTVLRVERSLTFVEIFGIPLLPLSLWDSFTYILHFFSECGCCVVVVIVDEVDVLFTCLPFLPFHTADILMSSHRSWSAVIVRLLLRILSS